MLAEMSSQELREWEAYFAMDAQYTKLVAGRTDPDLAFEAVYGPPKD